MNYQPIIESIYEEVRKGENLGQVATYIPELGNVSPDKFGICLITAKSRQCYAVGDSQEAFSIQSMAKVLSLTLAYRIVGEHIWKRVGVEPLGMAFNSMIQLEYDAGIPRNPLINAGAIVVCDILISELGNAKQALIEFVKEVSGLSHVDYHARIAQSEKETGFRNVALVNLIKAYSNIKNNPEEVLDLYFNLCSITLTCQEVAQTYLFLANDGYNIHTGKPIVTESQAKRLNAIMQTCGFYDEAGEFAFRVGLPGKSGVGGGIVAIHPDQYCIAVWSPRLNKKGNSYRGMQFLEHFTTQTKQSIF
jgi:glutaminase